MKHLFKNITLAILITFTGACKNDSKNANVTVTGHTNQHEEVVEDSRFLITIESNDQMQFDKKELKVPAGEPVVLTLKHVGKMAKNVMGHNLVILKQNVDFQSFAEKASLAADSDYIPASEQESIIVHTKVIGGGQSDTVEFTIAEPGTYEFLCTFPGHYAIMRGVVIVE